MTIVARLLPGQLEAFLEHHGGLAQHTPGMAKRGDFKAQDFDGSAAGWGNRPFPMLASRLA